MAVTPVVVTGDLPTVGPTFTIKAPGATAQFGNCFAVEINAVRSADDLGNEQTDASICTGFAGTNGDERCVASIAESGETPSKTGKSMRDDSCCCLLTSTTVVDGRIAWSQYVTDGVEFTVAVAFDAAYKYEATLWFSDNGNVAAKVFDFHEPSLPDVTESVNVGQQTDLLVCLTSNTNPGGQINAIQTQANFGVGYAARGAGGAITQACYGHRLDHAVNPTRGNMMMSNTAVKMRSGNGAVLYSMIVTSLDSPNVEMQADDATNTRNLACMSFFFDGELDVQLGVVDMPTIAGLATIPSPGMLPVHCKLIPTMIDFLSVQQSDPVAITDPECSVFALGVLDGSAERCVAFRDRDGQVSSSSGSAAANTAIHLKSGDGTLAFAAAFDAFIDTGTTGTSLNFTKTPGSANRKLLWVQVGNAPTPPQPPSPVGRGGSDVARDPAIRNLEQRTRRQKSVDRIRSLGGEPKLFRTHNIRGAADLPVPTIDAAIFPLDTRNSPVVFRTKIRIASNAAARSGLIFEFGDATHAIAAWLEDDKLKFRAGGTGADTVLGTYNQGAQWPQTMELDITFAVRPGSGLVYVTLNGNMALRAQNAAKKLDPDGAWTGTGNGSFASAVSGALPADVTTLTAPANFSVIAPLSVYAKQFPQHFLLPVV